MERILVLLVMVSMVVSACLVYVDNRSDEFQTFASEFESQLEVDGSMKMLNVFFYEKLTSEFALFKYTDDYKELASAYHESVAKESAAFKN